VSVCVLGRNREEEEEEERSTEVVGGWVGSDEEEVECDQPLVAAAAAFLDHHL
jgi:hypothetical protein